MKTVFTFLLLVLLGAIPLASRAAEDVDTTIAAARQAAHDDRNAEAARLFEQAVTAAPERRLELLPELSDQLTYSGKLAEAIALYRETLASQALAPEAERRAKLGLALALSWNHHLPESRATYSSLLAANPRDIDALLGHARVLSWEDQLTPALREYKRVLAIDPGNVEALENIARVQSWRGRQRDAQRSARALLAEHPGDFPASLTIADSELWMGRPDRAARDEQLLLGTHPNDSGLRDLAADLADARKPQLRMATSDATSSDGLLIRSSTFESEVRGAEGLTSLGIRYQPISYIATDANTFASEGRFGLFARGRLSDWSEINATASNDEVRSAGTATQNLFLYDTYLTLLPNDSLRFDIGSRKETFDNIISLQKGITTVFDTFSMDITPDENTRFTFRANQGSLSDGNRRGWEQVEFERAVVRQPHLSFGLRGTSYSYSQSPNNGYFDPTRYQSAELTTHIFGNARRRLYYDAWGAYGHEWVFNGGNRATHAEHVSLSYLVSRPISVSVFYDSFDTRQTNSGFARTTVGLALQTKW